MSTTEQLTFEGKGIPSLDVTFTKETRSLEELKEQRKVVGEALNRAIDLAIEEPECRLVAAFDAVSENMGKLLRLEHQISHATPLPKGKRTKLIRQAADLGIALSVQKEIMQAKEHTLGTSSEDALRITVMIGTYCLRKANLATVVRESLCDIIFGGKTYDQVVARACEDVTEDRRCEFTATLAPVLHKLTDVVHLYNRAQNFVYRQLYFETEEGDEFLAEAERVMYRSIRTFVLGTITYGLDKKKYALALKFVEEMEALFEFLRGKASREAIVL